MCPTLSLQLRCLGALGVREKNSFPSYPPPGELARRLFHTLQSCMTDHIVWETVMWNWCQGKHRCKIASFTGNFHVSCHKRQMPTRTSDAVVSACVADRTLPRLGTFATKADILGKDPQWTQPITREAFWISFHPDWEINNCPLNKPIIVHTQVLECTWGSRTAMLALFCRWTQPEV